MIRINVAVFFFLAPSLPHNFLAQTGWAANKTKKKFIKKIKGKINYITARDHYEMCPQLWTILCHKLNVVANKIIIIHRGKNVCIYPGMCTHCFCKLRININHTTHKYTHIHRTTQIALGRNTERMHLIFILFFHDIMMWIIHIWINHPLNFPLESSLIFLATYLWPHTECLWQRNITTLLAWHGRIAFWNIN